MSKAKLFIFLAVVMSLVACGSSSSDNNPSAPTVVPVDTSGSGNDGSGNDDGGNNDPIQSGQTVTLSSVGDSSECKAGLQSTQHLSDQERDALFGPVCQQAGDKSFQSLQAQCQQRGGTFNNDAQFEGAVAEESQSDCLLISCEFTATGTCTAQ